MRVLAALAFAALAGYAAVKLAGVRAPLNVLAFFVGAAVVHDAVLFPAYSALARLAGGRPHLLVPAALSGLAFLVWFPLILGLSDDEYRDSTGLTTAPFLGRWLLLTGALFAASALVYGVKSLLNKSARSAKARGRGA